MPRWNICKAMAAAEESMVGKMASALDVYCIGGVRAWLWAVMPEGANVYSCTTDKTYSSTTRN